MRTRTTLLAALSAAALSAGLAVGAAVPAQAATEGSATDRLVQRWYADFLGRPADEGLDASGRAYWVDQIDAGQDQRRILESILSSAEFAQRAVDGYYELYLGRDSDADLGSDAWKSGIRADVEPEWVEQNLLASAEFEQRTGASRVDQWYRLVLGRSGDVVASPEELAYWEGRIAAVGPLGAVRQMWYSGEGVERRIRLAFDELLERQGGEVGGGDVDFWYDRAFDSELGLRTELALSADYAALPASPPAAPEPPPPPAPAEPDPAAPAPQPSSFAEVVLTSCTLTPGSGLTAPTYRARYTLTNTDVVAHSYLVDLVWSDADGGAITTQRDVVDTPVGPGETLVERASRSTAVVTALASCSLVGVTAR